MATVLTSTFYHFRGRRLCDAVPRHKSSIRSAPIKFFRPSYNQTISTSSAMQVPGAIAEKEMPLGIDSTTVEEYSSQAKLLQEFTKIPSIDKAWIVKSESAKISRAMFSIGQSNLIANKKRMLILSSHISNTSDYSVNFQWSPFPVEMTGVSTVVPSPSGSKLLVVRNTENESPTQLEIWGPSQLEKEIHIPQSVHGSLYIDGWFEGISWNHEESLIAYVAEEPSPLKPVFNDLGYKKEGSSDTDCGSWKGQGDWEENWGETYSKKRKASLFVVEINSGEVRAVEGIEKSLSVGQVVWAPSTSNMCHKYLVFVGWSSENGPQQTARKLGIKYCYNRPCALYAVRSPFQESNSNGVPFKANKMEGPATAVNLTQGLRSAFFPRFSPDGKFLVFLSAISAVDSGAHSATDSLHRIDWPADGEPHSSTKIIDVVESSKKKLPSSSSSPKSLSHQDGVDYQLTSYKNPLESSVPVVMCPEEGCFPGLYCANFLSHPWLSDGCTMILSSVWRSTQVILSINVLSCRVSRVSPKDTSYSWNVLALNGDNILAVSSSPIDPPQIKYGCQIGQTEPSHAWDWIEVSSPLPGYSDKVRSLLSSLKFSILKIPVRNPSESLSKGATNPFEAIFVSFSNSSSEEDNCNNSACNPLIVILHGGPHSVSVSSYSKSVAYLCSLGYNLLIVNYRGSLGFGEEALQSLPGKIGSQDVDDVLTALDYVIEKGFADASKVAVLGGSHGGFLTTHLIGQAPDRFVVAAVRNPVCNLSLMVGTTDIPDWCYVEACGKEGKDLFSEAPSTEYLSLFFNKSPISHLSKVKAPILFLLGAQDLRVPVSNGLQYARALKEKGGEVKVIMFPEDVHGIERPQSDFESFLNIGVWFRKYCI